MKELISIIVPFYNREKYIERCLKSILAQTYANIEVVAVDDGSTDSSLDLVNALKEKDDRIVIVKKEHNSGVSDARNKGIEAAKGDFIGFVDSDDYIMPDMYEFLYDLIKKYDADISRCSYRFNFSDEGYELDGETLDEEVIYEGYDLAAEPLNRGIKCCIVCNRLFKRDVIENVRFDTAITQSEDLLFTYFATKNCKKMACHDISKYIYYKYDSQRDDIKNINIQSFYAFKRIIDDKPVNDRVVYRCFARIRMTLFELVKDKDDVNFRMVRKYLIDNENVFLASDSLKKDKAALSKYYLLKFFPFIYKLLIRIR